MSALKPPPLDREAAAAGALVPHALAFALSSASWVKWRSVWIEGSATFTIATSSTTMNWAATRTARAIQRRSVVWLDMRLSLSSFPITIVFYRKRSTPVKYWLFAKVFAWQPQT